MISKKTRKYPYGRVQMMPGNVVSKAVALGFLAPIRQGPNMRPLVILSVKPKGLVHTCRQNRELVSIDKVLRLFIDKLPVWTLDKKFQIMLYLFRNSLQTKSAICAIQKPAKIGLYISPISCYCTLWYAKMCTTRWVHSWLCGLSSHHKHIFYLFMYQFIQKWHHL